MTPCATPSSKMDSVTQYRDIIKSLLSEYQNLAEQSQSAGIESQLAFDEQHDQYIWLRTGWDTVRRVRGISIYIRIKNSKVWVEEDWTDLEVVDALIKAGIPATDIVLGFHPPEARQHTEFAVA